jgi:hypothetical protein
VLQVGFGSADVTPSAGMEMPGNFGRGSRFAVDAGQLLLETGLKAFAKVAPK